VGLSAAAALAVAAALLALGARGGPEVPVATVRAQRFLLRVPAEGTLRAVAATVLAVPTEARGMQRLAWLAEDGSAVAAGDLVARLDASDFEKRLADAEAALESARWKIEKERATAGGELGKLARDAEVAQQELAAARQFQKQDALIFSRAEIIESEIDGELAREKERHAREERAARQRLGQTDLALLAIEARTAQLDIDHARRALAALEVRAPHAGILVLRRLWNGVLPRVGDAVRGGQPLAEIPRLDAMEAEVFVLEADAGGLAAGQPAEVRLEAFPETAYRARVARVDALAQPRFPGSPVQYFAVTLELARTDRGRMKPGARVRAAIRLDDRAAALVVPRQAVVMREGGPVVFRRTAAGGFEPVAVRLGPAAAGRVVIDGGIAAGDVVALRDPARAAAAAGAATEGEPGQGREPAAGPGASRPEGGGR
jgi:RND family efflux transporter MFP subunit